MVKIAVVGAGINGVACAVKIKEKYTNYDVVLISKVFSPDTTGDGSGGLWYPYICGATPGHLLRKWGGETYRYIHKLWLEGGYNISMLPIYVLHRTTAPDRPEWADMVFGYNDLTKKHLDYINRTHPDKFTAGFTFTTFIVLTTYFIPYLYKRFRDAQGRMQQAEVTSLQDPILKEYDVVINCTGLGARYIVPDSQMFPVRGQVMRVIAPWVNEARVDEDSGNYILPNCETVVLGGTHQEHNYNTEVDDKDSDFIINGCKELMPGLTHAKIVRQWVGLRPARHEIRLEPEHKDGKLYIHNYGHGGSGFTLFWGCASEVLQILDQHINNTQNTLCKL